jgi:hypothetical protein
MQASLAAGLIAGLMTLATPALASGPADCSSGPMGNASRTDGYSLKRILRIAGLTADGQLVCLDDRKPGKVRTIGNVGGYTGSDTRLVGIDYRPQDGLLYGVGNAGGLYQVDTATAQLTQVGTLTVALDPAATAFDIDFNPAANALRIVGSTGQNLRQPFGNLGTGNPLAATVPDLALSLAGVVGAAYTNNDLSAVTGTTLFDLNATQVLLQSPPNNGTLAATGSLTVTATGDAGFDIYSVIRGDVTVAQRALAALNVDGEPMLYELNLLTGKATARSRIGANVVDIAVPLTQY